LGSLGYLGLLGPNEIGWKGQAAFKPVRFRYGTGRINLLSLLSFEWRE